jgi:hypothetical protein
LPFLEFSLLYKFLAVFLTFAGRALTVSSKHFLLNKTTPLSAVRRCRRTVRIGVVVVDSGILPQKKVVQSAKQQ